MCDDVDVGGVVFVVVVCIGEFDEGYFVCWVGW